MDPQDRDPEVGTLRGYVSRAADLNDAAHYSGGWAPFKHAAGYIAQRAAPIAMGALAGGGASFRMSPTYQAATGDTRRRETGFPGVPRLGGWAEVVTRDGGEVNDLN